MEPSGSCPTCGNGVLLGREGSGGFWWYSCGHSIEQEARMGVGDDVPVPSERALLEGRTEWCAQCRTHHRPLAVVKAEIRAREAARPARLPGQGIRLRPVACRSGRGAYAESPPAGLDVAGEPARYVSLSTGRVSSGPHAFAPIKWWDGWHALGRCKHCFEPRSAHPIDGWVASRPAGDRQRANHR